MSVAPRTIDLRESLNAISDVVVNRPPPIREFDQIYMKVADMLLQAEYVGGLFDNRRVVFVGDGDAIALCVMHLHKRGLIQGGPKRALVLDFDERVVNSIREFAKQFKLSRTVTARLYNVAEAIPKELWQDHEAFYTNPPYGSGNGGTSVEAFLRRAFELCRPDALGCLVIADSAGYPWCGEVLVNTQRFLLDNGFAILEVLRGVHRYHLADAPDLTSCNIAVKGCGRKPQRYQSRPLDGVTLLDFYGRAAPLKARYVRDLRGGGKYPSRDYRIESLDLERQG